MRPFKIVEDHGFQCLMKTGHPDYYIPLAQTVSHDIKKVFTQCQERIAKMSQVCEQDKLCVKCLNMNEPVRNTMDC